MTAELMIINDSAIFENSLLVWKFSLLLLREAQTGWQNYEGNLNVDFSNSKIGIYSD